jgi:nucleoside 2-deoxyribosyltransferase
MDKRYIYLCGQVTGATYEDARYGWRLDVAQALEDLDVVCLSPMRGKDHLAGTTSISPLGTDGHPLSTGRAINTRDLMDIRRSLFVFANVLGMNHISEGTCIEYGIALGLQIPVLCCIERDGSNPHEHAMFSDIIGWRCATLADGIMVARHILSEQL